MKRMMLAAFAAASLLLAGQGLLHAAGQPQCETDQQAGAAPGQQADAQAAGAMPGQKYGTEANVEEKKQMDAQKYQTTAATSAADACPDKSPAGTSSSGGKQ